MLADRYVVNMNRTRAVLLTALLVLGGGLMGSQAAVAQDQGTVPAGCTLSSAAPWVSGSYVNFGGSGYCNRNDINSFAARLVHNYDNLPDVRVKTVQSWGQQPNWSAWGATCDNGGTTQYYTEAGYYRSGAAGGDIILTSAMRTLTHC